MQRDTALALQNEGENRYRGTGESRDVHIRAKTDLAVVNKAHPAVEGEREHRWSEAAHVYCEALSSEALRHTESHFRIPHHRRHSGYCCVRRLVRLHLCHIARADNSSPRGHDDPKSIACPARNRLVVSVMCGRMVFEKILACEACR